MEQRLGIMPQEGLETPPFRTIEGDWSRGVLVICDHAENTLPSRYGTLGLRPEDLNRHIAYDLGAMEVAEGLAKRLGVPALLTRFSRLLIDPNRGLDDPTLIMQVADGLVVPGNAGLSDDEIEGRIAGYYTPYHRAIDRAIDAATSGGRAPVILSIHSFTQAWKSLPRPWHAAVLWDQDPRLALPLIEALKALPELVIGNNEPYSGKLKGDTLYHHATRRGLSHALVEIRQDLILAAEGQAEWAERLAGILERLLSRPDLLASLHAVEHFRSAANL